jgi:hypothetical protein
MDKRTTVRFVPRRTVTALLEDQDLVPVALARVADISEGGVCLWTDAALRAGDLVILQLSFPEELRPFQAAGRVVWTRDEVGHGQCGVAWATTVGPQHARLAVLIRTSQSSH